MFEIPYSLTQTDGKFQFNYTERIYIKHILCTKLSSLHYKDYKS